MTDWEMNNSETIEQFDKGLLEFVEKTEFGTPQYQAVSDYLHLKLLHNSLRQMHKNMTSKSEDPEKQLNSESQARVTEQKIALLEHSISQSNSRLEGYSNAHTRIDHEFDQFTTALTARAKELYANDSIEQKLYIADSYDSAFHAALDKVYKIRRGPSSEVSQ